MALGVALMAGACSRPSAGGAQPAAAVVTPATAIDGMYFSATSILTFQRGTWTRNLPAMSGAFTVSGNHLILSGQQGCPGDGTYTWTLEGDVLTLTKVKEACAQRDVQFISLEKWGRVHQWGEALENGQGLLLSDRSHVANFHGQLDVTGKTEASLDVSATSTQGLVFSPTVLIGAPGQTITLTITNPTGKGTENLIHNFTIDSQGVAAVVDYGGSVVVTVTFPQSGGLRFYCSYHARYNQQGELLVAA